MGAAKRITISLPENIVRAADEAAARCGRSRSGVIREALEWHLRVQDLPAEEPTPEERAALAAGRALHARGEFVTLDEIRRELAADLLAQRPEKSAKTSASHRPPARWRLRRDGAFARDGARSALD